MENAEYLTVGENAEENEDRLMQREKNLDKREEILQNRDNLLSQKDNVEVLKPKSLRDEMQETLLSMLERYQ
jgi:predicted DNA-binding transcriptional regulator YafY